MALFFWICWSVDVLILLVWLLETILTGSGSGLLVQLIAVVGLSWWLRTSSPKWALGLAAFPASVLLIFVMFYIFMFLKGNSHWN